MLETAPGKSGAALRTWLFFLTLLLSAGGSAYFAREPVDYEEKVLVTGSGDPLRVVYLFPRSLRTGSDRSHAAVVAVPPYYIPYQTMEIICAEVARRGAACAIPDLFRVRPGASRARANGDSFEVMTEDVLSVVGSLRSLPAVDPGRIGVCGHSVGGTVAALAAKRDPAIRSTVPIGMVAEVSRDKPANVLFLAGLYDEMHSPGAFLENLRESSVAADPQLGVRYGDVASGTARQVSIVPTTDHTVETSDPFLIRELLDWFAVTLDTPRLGGKGLPAEWLRRFASWVLLLCVCVLYATVVGRAAEKLVRTGRPALPGWLAARLPVLPLLAVVGSLWTMGQRVEIQRFLVKDLLLILVLAQEVVSHRVGCALSRRPYRPPLLGPLVLAALGIGVVAGFAAVSVGNYVTWPAMLAWYPLFCLNMATLLPYATWVKISPSFFGDTFSAVELTAPFLLLLSLVVLAPGVTVRGIERLARWFVESSNRFSIRLMLSPARGEAATGRRRASGRVERLQAVALVGLVVVLAVMLHRRNAEGMLSRQSIQAVLVSLLRFVVVPLGVAVTIVRTRLFKRLAGLPREESKSGPTRSAPVV
jgi:pimeloyl-ACP methyl ester carboxylesterase